MPMTGPGVAFAAHSMTRTVSGAQADQVGVLAEGLLVLPGVGTRGRRALREDDDEQRRRGADQRGSVMPARRWCSNLGCQEGVKASTTRTSGLVAHACAAVPASDYFGAAASKAESKRAR
jgi:hypothetical protein